METIVLGGGCFWCLDAGFKLIQGVTDVVAGYAGGTAEDADYYKVCTGATNHAEVVSVTFDTSQISLADILDIFWAVHDPTTLDRQGNDVGTQYRSVIFYGSDEQKAVAEESIKSVQELWDDPVVTELKPLEKFFPAEDYHQDYFNNNPQQAYCQVVINPKLLKLKQKFTERIKL